jgi:hypothetical protein
LAQDLMIGIGANLPSLTGKQPIVTARDAIITIANISGLNLVGLSRWYESAAMPPSGQPPYINAIAHLRGRIDPAQLLAALHPGARSTPRARSTSTSSRWAAWSGPRRIRSCRIPAPISAPSCCGLSRTWRRIGSTRCIDCRSARCWPRCRRRISGFCR